MARDVADPAPARPWHRFWPAHLPRSLDYPSAPAWWLLERNLPRFAGRLAVLELDPATLEEGRRLTYDELWRAARGVATGLARLGVTAGTRIGLCLPNSADLIIGYYATWCAGGVVVPANPAGRESEIAEHLGDAGVALVVGVTGGGAEQAAARLAVPFVELGAFRAM
ncbi:MAG TPA: hypothetical protein DCQ64_18855, partial [Candidatus Rokubacteria bacterium]|nr:hypothetical protein [Candidatus Rokubacteria bacterium]